MALRFTDLNGRELFEFHPKEYPESLPWDIDVKLNEIVYPDDHYTNQIIGAKLGEISFNGTFHGMYLAGSEMISALERSDELEKLIKRVVVINYAIGGYAGRKSTVIIKNYKRKIINYFEVEYELTMVPHEPQTRVKPNKVDISIAIDGDSVKSVVGKALKAGRAATKGIGKAGPKPKPPVQTTRGKVTTTRLSNTVDPVLEAIQKGLEGGK